MNSIKYQFRDAIIVGITVIVISIGCFYLGRESCPKPTMTNKQEIELKDEMIRNKTLLRVKDQNYNTLSATYQELIDKYNKVNEELSLLKYRR
jgi:hypothetical protein